MASLPPIPASVFREQVLACDSENEVKEESSLFRPSCAACEQHCMNRKAWQKHLKSGNHNLKTAETDSEISSESDESSLSNPSSLHTHKEYQPANQGASFSPLQC